MLNLLSLGCHVISQQVKTIRVYTQAIEMLEQGEMIRSIFKDMEEVWLTLYTKEKTCPILNDMGTNVKRLLVRRYTVALIKSVRNTIGLDLVTKVIDPDIVYWHVDDIVQRISDNKTESHLDLFRALLTAIFGLSIKVLDFMLLETKTKGDIYGLLQGFYDIEIHDKEYDDEITVEILTTDLNNVMLTKQVPMMNIVSYS